ncbi:M23 family peptidase [Marinicauda salina]|uniref:M23 family peptidase n=1 Tax=Marinicauda salina TaxID=2135793 RepID=A0A2U2BR21_9PROT|nr:M23 family peptidase [Marinicauda salina]
MRPSSPGAAGPAITATFQPDSQMVVCRGMRVSNAPPTDGRGRIRDYQPLVRVEGVWLLANPVRGACLTSGFGLRDGRPHRGLDLQVRPAGMVHAGGDGTILEAGYRDDFGNYVLIDHGAGVHTRYAHLQGFRAGVREGARVAMGQPLGLMGSTGRRGGAVHLHYELLIGDYDNPRRSFGLTAADILTAGRRRFAS